MRRALLALLFVLQTQAHAAPTSFRLTLEDAQRQAVDYSWRLKAAGADVATAKAQENASYASLFPRLSVQGSYTFLSTLPELSFAGSPLIQFGDHNNYTIGPSLSYTLWDTFASFKNYDAVAKIRESRQEDFKYARSQLLYNVRAAYVRLQLALEELKLVSGSLDLASAQHRDISHRFNAGAGTRLDVVISKRQILGFKLSFEQKQSDVQLAIKDLLALMGREPEGDFDKPGPAKIKGVNVVISLDTLKETLTVWSKSSDQPLPDDQQPQIKSMELMRESSEISATALKAKLFPTVQLNMSTALVYPNGPQLVNINQNTIGLTLQVPLYLGDPTWQQIEQKRSEARAQHYRTRQLKVDLRRDYDKSLTLIRDLKVQRELALQDVKDSSQVAGLYYSSYKEGKGNLTDVQTANTSALQSKVALARLDAQIINQNILLTAISGKDEAP